MNEMTLLFRKFEPWPSTLPLGDGGSPQYCIFTNELGRNIFIPLKLAFQSGGRAPRSLTLQVGSFNHSLRLSATLAQIADASGRI